MAEKAFRQTAGPLTLLRTAVGSPEAVRGKVARLAATLRHWSDGEEIPRRLRRLKALGFIDEIPSARQILVGAIDNFRYFVVPGVMDFYPQAEVNFTFHQILRFLDDPASMIDPTGLLSERDTIIGHLLQVVHNDPIYDFQLLEMFEDGLNELERQTEAVMRGAHPRAQTLKATTEDPAYYGKLLEFARAYRADPSLGGWSRGESAALQTPDYRRAKRTFATLPTFLRYCARLPHSPMQLALHLLRDKVVPEQWAEPE